MTQSKPEDDVEGEKTNGILSSWPDNLSADDENGNCKRCGHPFDPHIVIAYDGQDFSKGGEMTCPVEGCSCYSTVSFNFKTENEL
jgi:hypothetical protein